jgi:hypothetical protein
VCLRVPLIFSFCIMFYLTIQPVTQAVEPRMRSNERYRVSRLDSEGEEHKGIKEFE